MFIQNLLHRRGFYTTAAGLGIAIHFVLALTSEWIKSPTIDEYTYISTGYYYVKTGDFRLDRTHPPLIRLLIGLPLQFLSIREPDPHLEKWDDPISYQLGYFIGKEMLLEKGNSVQTLLLAARLPIILLSCGLAWIIFLWAKDLYGIGGGLISLFFYAFCPNLLAHAQLATLDLGISFFLVLAMFMMYRYTKFPTQVRLVWVGLTLGAALAAKVTALILIPVFAIALAWMGVQSQPSWREFPILPFCRRMGLLLVCALALLLLIYRYPFQPFYYIDTLQNVIAKSVSTGKGGLEVPGMPHRNYAFYLFGHYATSGWPYYYLAAAAVKTPLAVILALLVYLGIGKKRWGGLSDIFLVGTMFLLHGMAALNRVNIGLRHILPFYPLLYLYLGRIDELRTRRGGTVFLSGLAIWTIVSCAFTYPDFLSYFNEAVGGPQKGHLYLDDSNLDWGQDLGRLAQIQAQYPDEPMYIAQEYIFDPAAYGFSATPFKAEQIPSPPEGLVAISKQWAIRHRIQPRSPYYFNWLEKYQPIQTIGNSIWVFRF